MAELPHLVKMQKEFGGEQFSVIGLIEGTAQTAQHFSLTQKLNYPVFADDLDDADAILQQHFSK